MLWVLDCGFWIFQWLASRAVVMLVYGKGAFLIGCEAQDLVQNRKSKTRSVGVILKVLIIRRERTGGGGALSAKLSRSCRST